MNTTLSPASIASSLAPRPSGATKPLWAAVGVLSVCVMAMGATLVHVNHRTQTLAEASSPAGSAPTATPSLLSLFSATAKPEEKYEEILPSPPVQSQKIATKNIANQSSSKAVSRTAKPSAASLGATSASATPSTVAQAPSAAQPQVICTSCGTVEAVTPITREGQGSGVGVIAGGVLGGVVGNQVGKGSGRTAATVLGAIGGGWAGNKVEKNMKKTTAYSVRVRMEDGSSRTVEQNSSPMVGSRVTLDDKGLRPA
jgi:outer membrane lipoprotein SlyB